MGDPTPRRRWPFWAGFALFFVSGASLLPDILRPGVVQPVAFDHKVHVEKAELDCENCHATVRTHAYAGLPPVSLCMECHEEAQTDNPEEAKLREFGKAGKEIPWVRMFRQPGHVNYSHRRHVALGGLTCDACHGDIAQRQAGDIQWPQNLTMEDCIACHAEKEAGGDCTDCHR